MITQAVQLVVNGERISRSCEPRTHLGDFLRKDLALTGTHLSCEHGVCGACTVLIDGMPQRSCITFALACEGSQITTIEGYGDDPVMAALRQAFHQHHALQCGYCTPGMLCTARDIVLRLPGPDPVRVRNELAGNICRCTGYVGIVEAISTVLAAKANGALALPAAQAAGDVGLPAVSGTPPQASAASVMPADNGWVPIDMPEAGDWIEVRQRITLNAEAAAVWQRLQDLPLVARCLPGASVSDHQGGHANGQITIKFGPISANFAMRAELFLDAASRAGRMHAEGTDRASGTRVKTRLNYTVEASAPSTSQLDLHLAFQLAGPLAQFSRSGLVNDYVTELARRFGSNLQQAASGESNDALMAQAAAAPNMLSLLLARLRRWLGLRG